MTKYEEVAKLIGERIKRGEYLANSKMPNRETLGKEFEVSQTTLAKAMTLLIKDGLVISARGTGTYVNNSVLWGISESGTASDKEFDWEKLQLAEEERMNVSCEVLNFKVDFPNKKAQKQLLIPPVQPVYIINRIYHVNNRPYMMEELFIPTNLVPNLDSYTVTGSIYNYLTSKLKIMLAGSSKMIYARRANERISGMLNCKRYDPILVMDQVTFLKNGLPIEFSICQSVASQRCITMVNAKKR